MASNIPVTERWNISLADTSGAASQELMNSIMTRGGEEGELRVLQDHNMDPSINPLAYTIISYDNEVKIINLIKVLINV